MDLYIDRPENITDSVYIHMIYLKRYEEGHCVRDCMVVGFTTTYAISAYHYYSC
jgi:hypothetical protein